ncbi:hypothetical protein D3C83_303000 [compost metagenome]
MGAAREGHAPGEAQRSGFHRRAARLGSEYRSEFQGESLSRTDRRGGYDEGRLDRQVDRLWQGAG